MCVPENTHTHTCAHLYARTHVCMHVYLHVFACLHKCVGAHVCMCLCKCMHILTHMHALIWSICSYACSSSLGLSETYSMTHTTHTYTHTHTRTHTHACAYINPSYMHKNTNEHKPIYVHIWSHSLPMTHIENCLQTIAHTFILHT